MLGMKKISVVVLCFFAAGCAERQINEMSYSELVTLSQQIKKKCASEGAPQGSPNYETCWHQEVTAEDARRQAYARWREGAGMAFASGMSGVSQGYYQAAQPTYRPLNCTSSTMGAYTSNPTVNTSCY
jgi:hypothetical protein